MAQKRRFLADVGAFLALVTARHPPPAKLAHSLSLNEDDELVLMLALPDELLVIVLGAEALGFSPTDFAVEVDRMVQNRRKFDD